MPKLWTQTWSSIAKTDLHERLCAPEHAWDHHAPVVARSSQGREGANKALGGILGCREPQGSSKPATVAHIGTTIALCYP